MILLNHMAKFDSFDNGHCRLTFMGRTRWHYEQYILVNIAGMNNASYE